MKLENCTFLLFITLGSIPSSTISYIKFKELQKSKENELKEFLNNFRCTF